MFPQNGHSVPEIRFSGFTEDWEQRKLVDLVDRVTRKNQDLVSELPRTISAQYGLIDQNEFFATGVSIVIHPNHPLVPIIHMNIRYFEMDEQTRWFGGGIDLTPHYVIPTDARFFHHRLKQSCDQFDASFWFN